MNIWPLLTNSHTDWIKTLLQRRKLGSNMWLPRSDHYFGIISLRCDQLAETEKGRNCGWRKLNLHFADENDATGGLWLNRPEMKWRNCRDYRENPSPSRTPSSGSINSDFNRPPWINSRIYTMRKENTASIKVMSYGRNSFQHHKKPNNTNAMGLSPISIDQHVVELSKRWLFNGIFTVKTFVSHNGKTFFFALCTMFQHSVVVSYWTRNVPRRREKCQQLQTSGKKVSTAQNEEEECKENFQLFEIT